MLLVLIGVLLPAFSLRGQDDDAPDASAPRTADIDDLTRSIDADPQNADLLRQRGYAFLSSGSYARAIADLDQSIELDPKNPNGYRLRGFCYLRQNDADHAIEDYSKTIEYNPQSAIAFARRGQAEVLKGDRGDAQGDLDHACELARPGAQGSLVYTVAARAWRDSGDYDRSRADLEKAVQFNAKNAAASNRLAWLLATCPLENLRDGKKAVAAATTACTLTRFQQPAMIDTLAAAFAESGDFDSAIRWENEFLRSPMSPATASDAEGRLALYEARQPFHLDH